MAMRITVQVPQGMHAGQTIEFPTPAGVPYRAIIPTGVPPGGAFIVEVPSAPAAQAVQMGQTVPMGLMIAPRTVAEKHAECPICFEPLHSGPVGIFLDASGRRVSNHFFNLEAARQWLASGNGQCPLTRTPVSSVVPVPSITSDPDGWFRICDVDGNGKLSRQECIECLKAQLPIDNTALDDAANDPSHPMWRNWDKDGSGSIERNELLAPGGLADYVRQTFAQREPSAGPPDMRRDKLAWYRFWDEDGSGSLEKEEVVRALLKTLNLTQDPHKVEQMRSTIEAIWPVFDSDGSGSSAEPDLDTGTAVFCNPQAHNPGCVPNLAVEQNEFLAPGEGLADTIIATLAHS